MRFEFHERLRDTQKTDVTVFSPHDGAFDVLPAGTPELSVVTEALRQAELRVRLRNIQKPDIAAFPPCNEAFDAVPADVLQISEPLRDVAARQLCHAAKEESAHMHAPYLCTL